MVISPRSKDHRPCVIYTRDRVTTVSIGLRKAVPVNRWPFSPRHRHRPNLDQTEVFPLLYSTYASLYYLVWHRANKFRPTSLIVGTCFTTTTGPRKRVVCFFRIMRTVSNINIFRFLVRKSPSCRYSMVAIVIRYSLFDQSSEGIAGTTYNNCKKYYFMAS